MASSFSIGKLAEAAGVHVETIRYYQRRHLLAEPPKPLGGQRRYPEDVVKRVRFIKRAQALGWLVAACRTAGGAILCGPVEVNEGDRGFREPR